VVGKLLSLYIRAGVRVANLTIRVAIQSADLAVSAVRSVVPASEGDVVEGVAWPSESSRDVTGGEAIATPAADYDGRPLTPLDPATAVAKTLDDEPELVAEFAEAGAEGGASAEVEVDEPWEGYAGMTADEVIARISTASTAELGVLNLHERAHKNRRSVLEAVDRRQRELANAPS
jgi:hypothetical protein